MPVFWPRILANGHIRRGNAKTVESGLYQRIRGAYIAYCEKQVANLQHEIEIEKALATDDDHRDLELLEDEVRTLLEKIKARKTTV